MGTVFTIKCYSPDRESAEESMEAAFEEISRLEALLSHSMELDPGSVEIV